MEGTLQPTEFILWFFSTFCGSKIDFQPQLFTYCVHGYVVHVTCTQAAVHMHKFLSMLLIPLCKNNLNLPMCSFFLPRAWLPPPLIHHLVML